MLRALGFCGADDSVSPELLAVISERYNFVEWGILFREERQGEARFASWAWLDRLKVINAGRTMRLAGHLCSSRCEQVLNGDSSFVARLHAEVPGVPKFVDNTFIRRCLPIIAY
jgi:hypothetical protein